MTDTTRPVSLPVEQESGVAGMQILVTSNLDARAPFGQTVRPLWLGRGMAECGVTVGNLGIDCSSVEFGPTWTLGSTSLRNRIAVTRRVIAEFQPDVIYAHQTSPAVAAIVAAGTIPVVADVHALGSAEWFGRARALGGARTGVYVAAGVKARLGEHIVMRSSRRLIAAGEELAERIHDVWGSGLDVVVVPNGVDPALLRSARAGASPYCHDGGFHATATLPGAASPSNARALEFLEAVALEVRRREHPTTIHVVGCTAGPGEQVLRYEGFQPDLRPWLDHADALLLPYPPEASLCGGARNKLVEYLARGRTIVSTVEGLRGLREAGSWPGVHVAGDDAASFASALCAAVTPSAGTLDAKAMTARLGWDTLSRTALNALSACARHTQPHGSRVTVRS